MVQPALKVLQLLLQRAWSAFPTVSGGPVGPNLFTAWRPQSDGTTLERHGKKEAAQGARR